MSQSNNGPVGSGVGGIGGIGGLRGIDPPVTERPQVVCVTRGLAQARLACLGRAQLGLHQLWHGPRRPINSRWCGQSF